MALGQQPGRGSASAHPSRLQETGVGRHAGEHDDHPVGPRPAVARTMIGQARWADPVDLALGMANSGIVDTATAKIAQARYEDHPTVSFSGRVKPSTSSSGAASWSSTIRVVPDLRQLPNPSTDRTAQVALADIPVVGSRDESVNRAVLAVRRRTARPSRGDEGRRCPRQQWRSAADLES